ncbi:uncharacterized protein LOC101848820 [Aplysia californica]|uniref:Uncharacterized protein LOC101848820 n=1 Tax=Aplysia californica TaxID=6500 RepID=A0ABM0JQK4_APLCA|nr:uncharacterized protein LOC101848820 [Aplysia californica]XP_005099226.1 uncharacterized protein LOC101848820 [Aplysia californica]
MEKRQDKQENGFVGRIEGGEKELQKWWSRNMNQQQQQQHIDGANERVDEGNRNRGVRRSDRKGENGNGGDKRRAGEGKDDGVSLGNQLLLSAASFGVEMIVTFQTIYGVLSLQYLGVPMYLVSVHGVVCGVSSLFIIPLIGRFTDCGNNTRFRKAVALFIGLGTLLTAVSLISASTVFKIQSDTASGVVQNGSIETTNGSHWSTVNTDLDRHQMGRNKSMPFEKGTPSNLTAFSSTRAVFLDRIEIESVDSSQNIGSTINHSVMSHSRDALPNVSDVLSGRANTLSPDKLNVLPDTLNFLSNMPKNLLYTSRILPGAYSVFKNTSSMSSNISFTHPDSSYITTTIVPVDDISSELSHLPVRVVLAILGFAFLALSFGVSMSPTRAFILEIVPSWQHSRILATATATSSVAGMCLSGMGLLNVPNLFGAVLHIDRMAGTLLFVCSFTGLFATLSFSITVCAGFWVKKTKTSAEMDSEDHVEQAGPEAPARRGCAGCCFSSCKRGNNSHEYKEIPTEEDVSIKTHEDNFGNTAESKSRIENGYDQNSIHTSSLGFTPSQYFPDYQGSRNDQQLEPSHTASEIGGEEYADCIYTPDDVDWEYTLSDSDITAQAISAPNDNLGDFYQRQIHNKNNIQIGNKAISHETKTSQGWRLSNSFDHFQNIVSNTSEETVPFVSVNDKEISPKNNANRAHTSSSISAGSNLFNKRLVILMIASFFSYGTLVAFKSFASNSLTIAVYKGDPKAAQGSEARENYERGLRMCSVGVFTYYVAYFILSFCNKKILDIAGPRALFIVANLLMTAACLVFVYTSHLAAYFCTMLFCGLHKSMSYTVPFLLATQYSQPGQSVSLECEESEDGKKGSHHNLGRVTAMVGFLLTAHYLVVSCAMGPLMHAVGTAWPPMYYCACVSCLAAMIMSCLYFIK